eukprot:365634-Chlamydomonas_euryale.AAC.2
MASYSKQTEQGGYRQRSIKHSHASGGRQNRQANAPHASYVWRAAATHQTAGCEAPPAPRASRPPVRTQQIGGYSPLHALNRYAVR